MSKNLLYIADPMCSWCWGFAPAIEAIAQRYESQLTIKPVMGGLRALNRTPMDDAQKAEIAEHWNHVNERTGQPFDMSFFDRNEFVYDTEPACHAVCVVRVLKPGLTLLYLSALQEAFYTENRDITDEAVLCEIAEGLRIDGARFLSLFKDVMSVYETAGDFHMARQMQVTGYPSIVLNKGDQYAMLTAGYQPLEDLLPALDDWLAQS